MTPKKHTHDEAIAALCGCAATVSVLSYQEAIEGYFKLRGLEIPTDGGSTGSKAEIRDGLLVISIEIDALPMIVSGSCATNSLDGLWKVTDAAAFAEDVRISLNAESENGTTRVHRMFDGAFAHAIDQGAEGIEPVGEGEFEDECGRLQRAAAA